MTDNNDVALENELRKFWSKIFDFNWKFGLLLVLIVCIPRFILVLNANQTANYRYIGLIMTISAIAPFVFLSKHGRKEIGITKPKNYFGLLLSSILGILFSLILYAIGEELYKNTFDNWYVYIGKSYSIPTDINPNDKLIMFSIMAVIGMIFSPIGEELFFRGIVHSSFAKSFGNSKAAIVDSTAFAVTHISHFGLIFINNQWTFKILPTIIWVSSMFLVSMLFHYCRKKTSSILGAIICHSTFNLGMTYSIFYLLP